jgi:hypothetical protein
MIVRKQRSRYEDAGSGRSPPAASSRPAWATSPALTGSNPARVMSHISGLDRLFDRCRAGQAAERARERRPIRFVPGGEHDPLTAGGQVPRNRAADVPGPDDRGSHRLSSLRRGTR